MPTLLKDAVDQAVEIARAAGPMQSGSSYINTPDAVAKFIEVVAKKIHELRVDPSASKI
jgi:hypothetical protein